MTEQFGIKRDEIQRLRPGRSRADVLGGKQFLGLRVIQGWLFRAHLVLLGLVYAIWLESRSSAGRILFLRSMMRGQPYLSTGAAIESASIRRLVPNKRTSARSHDIQLLREGNPWATVADLQLFLLGWNKGEEFAGRGFCSPHSYNEQTTANS